MPARTGFIQHPDLFSVSANARLVGLSHGTVRAKMLELYRREEQGIFQLDTGDLVTDRDGTFNLALALSGRDVALDLLDKLDR